MARELQKLPPVLFDHVDVTQILKDLVRMRADINKISEEYASKKELHFLKQDLDNLKTASIVNNFPQNINPRRGACLLDSYEYNSGPMGLHPIDNENDIHISDCSYSPSSKHSQNQIPVEGINEKISSNVPLPSTKSPVNIIKSAVSAAVEPVNYPASAGGRMTHASIVPAPAHATSLANSGPCYNDRKPDSINDKSYTDILKEGEWKSQVKSESWILVQKKRLRNRFIGSKGKAAVDTNSNFKAADVRVPLYVYNIAKDVTAMDIQSYIKSKTEIVVELEKINMKSTKEYDAYKVFVPKSKLSVFLQDEFWPEGVAYRKFVDFRKRYRGDQTHSSNKNQV